MVVISTLLGRLSNFHGPFGEAVAYLLVFGLHFCFKQYRAYLNLWHNLPQSYEIPRNDAK